MGKRTGSPEKQQWESDEMRLSKNESVCFWVQKVE